MSLESDLFDALGPLCGDRVYPAGEVPPGAARPYIAHEIVGAQPVNDFEGFATLRGSRVQIDCFDVSRAGARALGEAVLAAMNAFPSATTWLGAQGFFEEDTKLRRVALDFSVWHS